MHREHKHVLAVIQKGARPGGAHGESYLSSAHKFYNVSVPARRKIAKDWLRAHKDLAPKEFMAVLDSLFEGASHEEKTIAALMLSYAPKLRALFGPKEIDRWLDHLQGWAEIDTLCQNVFTAEELLADWPAWKKLIEKLARDKNINKRRAALVLLTGPTHYSDDARFADLAFASIDRLKSEKEIILTKAVSWLLRSMVMQHKKEVARYVAANADSLPAIAVRETRTKLKTGTKKG